MDLFKLESRYNVNLLIDIDKDLYDYDYIDISGTVYRLPKKYNTEWIESKIMQHLGRKSNYNNLAKVFNSIIENYDIKAYPTSYGVGINMLYSDMRKQYQKKILDILDNNRIDYRLEYSEAFWVMRIIISKSKTNIDKVKGLI